MICTVHYSVHYSIRIGGQRIDCMEVTDKYNKLSCVTGFDSSSAPGRINSVYYNIDFDRLHFIRGRVTQILYCDLVGTLPSLQFTVQRDVTYRYPADHVSASHVGHSSQR